MLLWGMYGSSDSSALYNYKPWQVIEHPGDGLILSIRLRGKVKKGKGRESERHSNTIEARTGARPKDLKIQLKIKK